MTRRLTDPASMPGIYSLLGALVVPRPIGWVSTRSVDGVDNLAPHSFYQLVSTNPPIVMISTMGEKDTARNIKETGEFVVCGSTVELIEQVNMTGIDFESGISEFDIAGLTREPSDAVAPLRVAESPYALECRCTDMFAMGNGIVIFGEVVMIAVDERVMNGKSVSMEALNPVARLGASDWSALGEIFDVPRLSVADYEAKFGTR
jgi:flavin reductase (DIM6/NTAB) family NADH-FMN oxidoreductase RutF